MDIGWGKKKEPGWFQVASGARERPMGIIKSDCGQKNLPSVLTTAPHGLSNFTTPWKQ